MCREGGNWAKLPHSKFSRVQKHGSTVNQLKAFAGRVCSTDFKLFHLDLKYRKETYARLGLYALVVLFHIAVCKQKN